MYNSGIDIVAINIVPIMYFLSIPAVNSIIASAIQNAIAVPKSGCFIINNNGIANVTNIISSRVGLFISSAYLSCIFDITYVKYSITAIFANSDGWNEKNPMSNQLVAPFTGFVNITAISRIINIVIKPGGYPG